MKKSINRIWPAEEVTMTLIKMIRIRIRRTIRRNRGLQTIRTITLRVITLRIITLKIIVAIQGAMERVKNNHNYKHSFLLALILNKLEVAIPKEVSDLVDFSSGILVLSLIVIFCVYNVFMFNISNWLLDKYDIEKKISYSWIKKIVERYRKYSFYYIIVEFIFIFALLLVIIITCLAILGISIFRLF
uniref:Uncharacterized protein n=1 Tax=Termitomyces sp. TaxID=1916073 RepID=A0A386TYP8_9AGAR|nr:hypothetical protein C0992_000063 [Termitomyces sp.]